jgi:hypothetical protein
MTLITTKRRGKKMEEQWIEVFRTGTHTDMGGNSRAWSDADLDKIVASYDPGTHEAPAVIGHPKENHPAFGWVESLKRAGNTLLARFRQLDPAFSEAIKSGQYKKRSIALYPDLSLRHVGFLGAMPPAVKGLKDIAFLAYAEAIIIEFGETANEPGNPEGAESMEDKERITQLEAQLAASVKETEAALSTATAFAEAEKAKDAELMRLKTEAEAKENLAFCDKLIADGKLPQGLKEQAAGLLASTAPGFQFSEGKTLRAEIIAFLEGLPTFDPSQIATHATYGEADLQFEQDKQIARQLAGIKEEK